MNVKALLRPWPSRGSLLSLKFQIIWRKDFGVRLTEVQSSALLSTL